MALAVSCTKAHTPHRGIAVAEDIDDILRPGGNFDPGPFALDLYRLLCIVLADKAVAKLTVDERAGRGVAAIQAEYRKVETIRILVSSAVALRIMFDRYPKAFGKLPQRACGVLYPKWPNRTREDLTLREACNKVVHAIEINDDLVIPDKERNVDEEGSYVRPVVYLYGTRTRMGGVPSYPSLNLRAAQRQHLLADIRRNSRDHLTTL